MSKTIILFLFFLTAIGYGQSISTLKPSVGLRSFPNDTIKKNSFIPSEDTLIVIKKRDNTDLTVYPNPFKRMTTVTFSLPKADTVSLKVLDVEGRTKQSILKSMALPEGEHIFEINAEDLPSDFYIVQLSSRKGRFGKKVLLKE